MTSKNNPLFFPDWQDEKAESLFTERILQDGGYFWGRLGGSDFDATARYFHKPSGSPIRSNLSSRIHRDRRRVRNLNGFFDKNKKSLQENYLRYLNTLHEANISTKGFMFANSTLIDFFLGENKNENISTKYAKNLAANRDLINYGVVEGITPFLNSISKWGHGAKILIVSPFSQSLKMQIERSDDLLVGFKYPKFELLTYTTPITYNNSKDISNDSIVSKTSNWNSELELMISEISSIPFDVALLSCGSYAPPIGLAIQNMGKKAIYLGGVLNVYFNIRGKRYENDFVKSISNEATRIYPLESSQINEIRGGRSIKSEAINAYFN